MAPKVKTAPRKPTAPPSALQRPVSTVDAAKLGIGPAGEQVRLVHCPSCAHGMNVKFKGTPDLKDEMNCPTDDGGCGGRFSVERWLSAPRKRMRFFGTEGVCVNSECTVVKCGEPPADGSVRCNQFGRQHRTHFLPKFVGPGKANPDKGTGGNFRGCPLCGSAPPGQPRIGMMRDADGRPTAVTNVPKGSLEDPANQVDAGELSAPADAATPVAGPQ